MKRVQLERMLQDAGWWVKKYGKHIVYTNGKDCVHLSHTKEINGKTVHFILKNTGVK